MAKVYRIERIHLTELPIEITVPDDVTPLITPDGSSLIIVEQIATQHEVVAVEEEVL